MKPKPYRIELFVGADAPQKFFARLVSARNGQTIASSEGYATKRSRAVAWNKLAAALKANIVEIVTPRFGDGELLDPNSGGIPEP